MKRKDLVVGEVYAWTTTQSGSFASPVTLVSADLHEQGTRRSGRPDHGIHPAPAHETAANSGGSYPYVVRGVLVTHESGKQGLVNPAHLRDTWEDWKILQARRDTLERAARESRKAQLQQDQSNRARIRELIAASPWAGRPGFTPATTRATTIDNTLLIEILEQLADQTADIR